MRRILPLDNWLNIAIDCGVSYGNRHPPQIHVIKTKALAWLHVVAVGAVSPVCRSVAASRPHTKETYLDYAMPYDSIEGGFEHILFLFFY